MNIELQPVYVGYRRPGDQYEVDCALGFFEDRFGSLFRALPHASPPSFDDSVSYLGGLEARLSILSRDIESIDQRVAFYAGRSATTLHEFSASEACNALFKRGLAERPNYLREYFAPHLDNIKDGVQKGDYGAVVSSIRGLYQATTTLQQLIHDWDHFRELLAVGLEEREGAALKYDDFDELRHSIHIGIYPKDSEREFQFSHWPGVLSDLEAIERLSQLLKMSFDILGWKFDAICTMSASTMTLVDHLAPKVQASWVAADNRTLNFTRPLRKHEAVLLLDTMVDTGAHFVKVRELVEKATEEPIVGFFCLVHNDLQKQEQAQSSLDLRKERNQFYFYEMSELYESWRARHGKAAPTVERDEVGQGAEQTLESPEEQQATVARLQEFSRDRDWLLERCDELKARYPDEYVAVLNGDVVAHAKTVEDLLDALKRAKPEDYHKAVLEFIVVQDINIKVV